MQCAVHLSNTCCIPATQANDAYPWTKEFGFSIIDVVQGLRPDQVSQAVEQKKTHPYCSSSSSVVQGLRPDQVSQAVEQQKLIHIAAAAAEWCRACALTR
jgi:hypothetical protein